MKTKTYISGKISGLPESEYKPLFKDAYMFVFYRGEEPIAPIYIKPFKGIYQWWAHMISDIKALFDCDKILMLPTWIKSKGAIIEWCIAKLIGLEVEFYKSEL
jgi:hypothetical protein